MIGGRQSIRIMIGGVEREICWPIDRRIRHGKCRYNQRRNTGTFCSYFNCKLNNGDCEECQSVKGAEREERKLLHCNGCSRSCDNVGNPNCDFYNLQ